MPAIHTRMPAAFPGTMSRRQECTAEPIQFGATPPTEFGMPVDKSGNALTSASTATDIYGFAITVYPTMDTAPVAKSMGDALRRGYLNAKVRVGSPSRTAKVYIRINAGTDEKPVGGIEAVADGANTIELTNAQFLGEALDGVTEISFNL